MAVGAGQKATTLEPPNLKLILHLVPRAHKTRQCDPSQGQRCQRCLVPGQTKQGAVARPAGEQHAETVSCRAEIQKNGGPGLKHLVSTRQA